MEIELTKKPQGVTIIEGFPGFGLVGTISTEFLLDHLDAKKIGHIWFNEMNPMVAIHDKKVIDPLGIFYNKKNNLVILQALTNVNGLEWKLADVIDNLAKKLKAKEVISLEGVGALKKGEKTENAYYYSFKNQKKWSKTGIDSLNEGIVIGVTASLLLKLKSAPLSCIFVETSTGLPDSRAAAKLIEVLDKYLGLGVDYSPLIKKAEMFEDKIKNILKSSQEFKKNAEKQELNYMG
jgi:uncharacterized protein